jgi:hypothetical protein
MPKGGAVVLACVLSARGGDGLSVLLFSVVSVEGDQHASLQIRYTRFTHKFQCADHHCPPVPRSISAWVKLLNGRPLSLHEAMTAL